MMTEKQMIEFFKEQEEQSIGPLYWVQELYRFENFEQMNEWNTLQAQLEVISWIEGTDFRYTYPNQRCS